MKDEIDDRANKAVIGGSSNSSQSNDGRTKESLRGGNTQRDREKPLGPPHVCLGRYTVKKHRQGEHDQATHGNWAGDRYPVDSVKGARDGAKEYAFKKGLKPDETIDYTKVVANRERASRIADIYETLPKMDRDAVDEYEALASEVEEQFDFMTKTLGVKVEFVADDPYKTSKEMFDDVSRGNLKVLQTETTGAHPLFSDAQNNKFRAVHDYFGHSATGRGFGQDGEEAAWVHHSQMFTEKARGALTTETRGQNSFFNNRGKQFADQKVALLPEEFWAVSKVFQKNYKVIRFAPGLKPIFKHLPGEHDQSTHGAWANAGYTDSQQMQIAAMEGRGPTLDDLNNMNSEMESAGYSDLIDLVNNDSGLYEQAIDGIDERVARAMEDAGIAPDDEQRKMSIYDQVQTEMIDEFVEADDGSLAEMWQEQNSSGIDSSQMLEKLNEVYSFEHTGTNIQGEEITLRAEIQYIDGIEEGNMRFTGNVLADDGSYAGEFERTFYQNDEGGWSVEHDLFRMEDEYAGTGFGTEFIKQQEAYYIAQGFDSITVGTAWDGARHWARQGYDWNPGGEQMTQNVRQLLGAVQNREGFEIGSQNRQEFDNLFGRMVVGYVPGETSGWDDLVKLKDMKSDDFPIPADFANLGIDRKTKTGNFVDWAGKELTAGLHMKYQKVLTAEAVNILGGPIDRDGDGLVYDGTPREKPAPK